MKYVWLRDGKPWKDTYDLKGKILKTDYFSPTHFRMFEYGNGLSYYFGDKLSTSITYNRNSDKRDSYKDEPAVIEYDGERIDTQIWYEEGKIHRNNDKPAIIYLNKDGSIREKYWMKEGNYSRDNDKPTHVLYFKDREGAQLTWRSAIPGTSNRSELIKQEEVDVVPEEFE